MTKFGVERRFITLDDLANLDRVIGPKTKMVWFESPINPTLRCVDVRKVAAACKKAGVMSVIDNTFAGVGTRLAYYAGGQPPKVDSGNLTKPWDGKIP